MRFPYSKEFHMMPPTSNRQCGDNWQISIWNDLRKACQSLENIRLESLFYCNSVHTPTTTEEKQWTDNFMTCVVSSPQLRFLDLNLGLHPHHMVYRNVLLDPYSLGSAAAKFPTFPLLEKVTLHGIKMNQQEAEAFCQKIGQGLKLFWADMTLESGSWVRTLEILRDRLAHRSHDGLINVFLNLKGGDMHEHTRKYVRIMYEVSWRRPPILSDMEKYLTGERDDNPLTSVE
ncbi:hypothetical protein B0T21DRAFT_407830 [Apiosordaria backusii]|uniref:Uncharacterized protein n=1 Tax=Apiosordaria backusii TaxID=314023 RepID=A0AA40K3Y4_9PEZI|nr:hypothetical protein B0T21DRAFT_407830 [Apiosordaria backusii]